jgi:hypothetical protein
MKITESNNELIWSDKPLSLKLFGLIFSALGLMFLTIAANEFLKSNDFKLQTFLVLSFMGVGFVAMGTTVIWAFKTTEVRVNRLMQQVIYKHGKVMRKFAVSEIDKIEYVEGYDSDVGTIFTPMLRTKNGEKLNIYRGNLKTHEMDDAITKFNSFLHKA